MFYGRNLDGLINGLSILNCIFVFYLSVAGNPFPLGNVAVWEESLLLFMKKLLLIFLIATLLPFQLRAGGARVSVLTCSPGDEAYSLFGHTALRYCDESSATDLVFNYGYFDFGSPNFIWRFILGETDYMVGAVPFRIFLIEYKTRGAEVVEQVLNLTEEQKALLIERLVANCEPENRVYRYNYFYNNCTTKVRDMVASVLGGDSLHYSLAGFKEGITFRDEIERLTSPHPWYKFGILLLLGSDIDKPTTRQLLQFIPANYSKDLDSATIELAGGETVPMVLERNILLEKVETPVPHSNLTPFNLSLLLLLLTFVVMLCELRSKKCFWVYDVLLMLLQGLCGLLLLFMATFSQHPAVGANWLLLLLNPLALLVMPVLVLAIRKKKPLKIAWVQVVFVLLFIVSGIFSLQVYPAPIYFCAIALFVRSLFHIYKERICDLNIV